jgi:dipeptidase D
MSVEVIKDLKPSILWERFYGISQIPRPSKKEEKILAYLKNLCNDLNVKYKQDKIGNLLITVPATPGKEQAPVVVLQAHVDMVCEKNKDTQHDFDNDPIKLIRSNGWLKAEGTTLGSDNGVGAAAALALITDKDAQYGPLEILLTVDEETGLTGANNLESGFISGKILLNLDSEEDGAFYVGCSGGMDTMGIFNIKLVDKPQGELYEVMISGLKGGHSGLDIHTGRGNAIKVLARTLKCIENSDYSVAFIDGGNLRNAIPREAYSVILLSEDKISEAEDKIRSFEKELQNELKVSDGGLKISFKKHEGNYDKVYDKKFFNKVLNTLLTLPHGVITMSQDLAGLVETSTNLATVKVDKNKLKIGTSQRSSIESAKKGIAATVKAGFELAGAKVQTGDGYPGWKPDMDSQILNVSKKVYKNMYGNEPEIKAIHAGLECGILGSKNPGLDMISFGPTIEGAHSPDEKVKIDTVEKFYDLLKGILKELAA